jgi:hypothetical protein
MLRSGLILLLISMIGVTMRSLEVVYAAGPTFKVVCSSILVVSFACFMGTYMMSQVASSHKAPAHK